MTDEYQIGHYFKRLLATASGMGRPMCKWDGSRTLAIAAAALGTSRCDKAHT